MSEENKLTDGEQEQPETTAENNDGEPKVKHNVKDSVFVDIFGDKSNACQLYKDLHPEKSDITADDIMIQTIQSVLVNTIYNDLGFIVKDKEEDRVIVLFEAQSTWNDNMTLRIFMYLAESYRRYLSDTGQSEHIPKKVHLPMPELYMVYTGEKKSVPNEISFNEVYFDGKSSVDMKIKVLKDVNGTLYGQYIGFCKTFNEQRKIHKNGIECVEKTIEICIEKGYLSEYLKAHKKEVVSMMTELFDEIVMRKQYETAARNANLAEGEAKGRAEGRVEGRAEGTESEKTNTVLRMLSINKFTFEEIAAVSALTLDQVKKIAAEHKPIQA